MVCSIAFQAILVPFGKKHLIRDHEAIEKHVVYPEEYLTVWVWYGRRAF